MSDSRIPLYLITGFLDAGKTTLLSDTLNMDYFNDGQRTVLLLCEDGEEEYDQQFLSGRNCRLVPIEDQEGLNTEFLKEVDRRYQPERVLLEFNGMWPVDVLRKCRLPRTWGLYQAIHVVDGSTFEMYLNNMQSMFIDMVSEADMVLFNRCSDIKPLAGYRRSVKVVSPQAEVIFEDEKGEVENIFENDVPYDMEAPVIEIRPEDYGIWYVDMMEHPDKYKGKVVEYTAKVLKPRSFPSKTFLPGRMAMTCCADDTTFLGYLCKSAFAPKLKPGQWVKVRAKIGFARTALYRGTGPVLEAENVEMADPIEELVYFN